MAWRSFGYEVTPMAAARRSPRVVRAPSPPQELQAPIGQSFDDMIEEIRRLRANVWPRGLHPEALQESTEELRLSPSNPGTEGPELSSRWLSPSPSRASRASRASRGTPTPGVEPSTLEHSGLRATPRTRATPSDRRLKRPPPWSPLRPTLWEERQVLRCLQEWHSLSASGASAVHRAYASEDHLPPALAPSVASRLDRCWHAWRRLVQSDRAGELELSVQLLRMQMARSQRRCIHWWHRWAERGPGRNDRRRFRPCAQRMALRRWREALLEKRQWQAMRDQVMSLLRISTMRRTLHWLAHLHVRPEKVRRQQRRALARQAHYRQSLRKSWLSWVRYASLSRRRLHAQQRLDRNQAAQALGRLRRWVRERRHLQDRLRVAQIQRKAHTLLSRLQTWHRTVRGRRQRQVQLEGHLRNCRQPRRARRVLSAWATWTRQEQRNQATLHKARIVLDLSLKSRSFHAWLQRRLSVSKAQEQLRGVLGRLDSSASVLCLAQWRHAALRQAKERSVLTALASGLERILQRGALHDLLETMRVARRHAHLAETLQHVQNRSIFARTLALWRAAARRRHLGTQRLRGLHGRFEESSFARCWVGWRLMAQQVRQERQAIHTLAAGLGCLRKAGALQRLRRHARHVSLNEQLEGWQHARLARRMLRRWEALYRANGFRQHQQSRVLIARILGAWLVLTLHSLELAHYRVTQGLARRAGFLLQLAIYWWWTALQKIRQFKVLVPVLVDSLAEATSAHGRRSQWSAWQRWWRIVEASRFAEAEELLYMSFQSWRSGIIEQRHKRGVHLLCERYRDVRMKRKSLFAWKRRLERLSAVTSSVEFWAAGRCSNAAQRALRGWREAARRRASARQGAQRMLQRRRCAFLASWRLLMLRKITAMGLQEAVLLSRALRWLRAWSGWAFAHARQRQSDEVKWAIVRQSRQRWVLERWCSAGRFQRLVLVAEKWDGQVLCRQLVLRAFTGWSAMMGLYACGEKVAAAVGARRASRLLRHWSFLLLVGEKRPHHLMRQMLARWRLFKHRSGEVQRGLERLGRWTLAPTFRRWATYLRDRKTRQQMASTHGDRMQASSSRRAQATALRWWHHSTQEVRRERRLDAQNGHDLERESERQLAVARVRQKGVLNLWREALLFHKAALWQQERPRLVMDITGQSWMATSFRVLAQRSRKRLKTGKAQEVVQATLARRRRARYFDLWAQVFEMESSSFFASQILGRGKLKRILDRWKQHTTFHAGFASQVLKTLQQSNLQRLQRAFRGWQERLHLRRLVAGMWLFRRRSWINAVFMAWNDEAVKAASTRRHLRSFFQAVRYSKASRAGSLQRKRVHGRLTGKVFRAYATWVKRAKVIQARSTQLNRAVRAGRKTQRLGAWAMYCRAFSVASSRAGEIFRAWLVQARRKKALTWASRSLAADTVRHAYTEGLQNLRSWAVFRRTLRQMVAGRRSTLLSSVLYCWVAALMPARHAVAELQRRAQLRLLLVFDAWARRATVVRRRHSQAQAVGDRSRLQRSREVAAGWFQQQKRLTAARRVFQVLDRVDRRWTGEEDWMRRAVADKNLQAMFRRFAEALDQQSSSQGSLLLRGAFQSVIAMVWARQQLSVVLGRLRGYFQPWLLGWWPMSSYPLLSPEDPYFMQAEIRLRVMMSQLDALRAQEQQPSVYKLMQDSEPNSKLISWQALADLLVVHHPGTATGRPRNPAPKTILEPVAKGIVPLAPHFGRDARQRAWLLPFSGCGDTAGGPIPWSYDSGNESAVSFGTPAFGSGDQAAGILV